MKTKSMTGTGLALLAVAVLFVMSFVNLPSVQAKLIGDRGTISGEVTAVDNLPHMGVLTLQSSQIGRFPNDTLNIFTNNKTKVMVCKAYEPLKDLKVDHNARVAYHEVGGVAVAKTITEKC
jgi:hypothetical protein